jgi:hypothetical protein
MVESFSPFPMHANPPHRLPPVTIRHWWMPQLVQGNWVYEVGSDRKNEE